MKQEQDIEQIVDDCELAEILFQLGCKIPEEKILNEGDDMDGQQKVSGDSV